MDPSQPPAQAPQPSTDVNPMPVSSPPLSKPAKSGHNGPMEVIGSILTVILLLVFFPLGLIVMWIFTKWPKIAKIIITLFFLVVGGWLLLVGLTVNRGLQSGAKDAQRRTDIQIISKVLEEHFDPKAGQYPPPQPDWFTGKKIPQDPAGKNYQGIPTGPVTEFKVCATLDNATVSTGPTEYCVENQR